MPLYRISFSNHTPFTVELPTTEELHGIDLVDIFLQPLRRIDYQDPLTGIWLRLRRPTYGINDLTGYVTSIEEWNGNRWKTIRNQPQTMNHVYGILNELPQPGYIWKELVLQNTQRPITTRYTLLLKKPYPHTNQYAIVGFDTLEFLRGIISMLLWRRLAPADFISNLHENLDTALDFDFEHPGPLRTADVPQIKEIPQIEDID